MATPLPASTPAAAGPAPRPNPFPARLFALLAICGTTLLTARLFALQVVLGNDYRDQASSLSRDVRALPTRRGPILARDGKPIVVSEPSWVVELDRNAIPVLDFLERFCAALPARADGSRPEPAAIERALQDVPLRSRRRAVDLLARRLGYSVSGFRDREQALLDELEDETLANLHGDLHGVAVDPAAARKVREWWVRRELAYAERELASGGPFARYSEAAKELHRDMYRRRAIERPIPLGGPASPELLEREALSPSQVVPLRAARPVVEWIASHPDRYPMLTFVFDPVRTYPQGNVAPHVLGYLTQSRTFNPMEAFPGLLDDDDLRTLERRGSFDFVRAGARGVEASYDGLLAGSPGVRVFEKDARGREQRELVRANPVTGGELRLSLAMGAQRRMEKACESYRADLEQRLAAMQAEIELAAGGEALKSTFFKNPIVTALAMDVTTGEILVWVSSPGYDVTSSESVSAAFADDSHDPVLDRVIADHFQPGSTWKVMVALAALEEGVITPGTSITCNEKEDGSGAWHKYRGLRCPEHRTDNNVTTSLEESCNVFYYKVAEMLGSDRLYAWAQRFGFGDAVGVDRGGEVDGVLIGGVEHPAGKYDTPMLGIGHKWLVTPLQMLNLMNRVATDGRGFRPHLNANLAPEPLTPIELKNAPDAWRVVKDGMRSVVDYPGLGTGYGTARKVKDIHKVELAGKTGTAALSARPGAWSKVNTSWFAGFAPQDKPRFAFVVMVHRAAASGADAAAPLAVEMMKALKEDPEFAKAWE